MKKIIKIESNVPSDFLRIELFLSNVCNYKCWYCFPGCSEGTKPWPQLGLLVKNLGILINYYKKNQNKKTILLHIIGGEPTLWKDFEKFVVIMKTEYNCLITMSTNGSRTLRWWDEYGHYLDHIMFSCHHERVDTDHIISVLDLLYSKDINITSMVLMDPSNWDKCVNIVEDLKKSKHPWPITIIELIHDDYQYTKEQIAYFEEPDKRLPDLEYWFRTNKRPDVDPIVTFEDGSKDKVHSTWIPLNKLNFFYNWECSIGIETFYIDADGFMRGACNQKLYNLDFSYNIFDPDFDTNFNPTIVPVICKNVNACTCKPEINASKSILLKKI